MSNTMMSMTAARPAAKKDCGCGCGGSGSDCCEIECLVHPRFFCGQLLADQDLTALVDWVKAKGALARYRHGWGVVCGLDVHCGKGGKVTVSPGYAMDCCGRDIVVCEETPFDLTSCWKRPNDPCDNGAAPPASMAMFGSPGMADNSNLFGFIPGDQLQAVDILIRYSESQSDSRTALARGGCGGAAGCEYTRVHEGFEIYCRPADGCEVDPDPSIEWQTHYDEKLAKLRGDLDRIVKNAKYETTLDRRAAIERFKAYVTRQSPHAFCFIREWLCYLQDSQQEIDPKDEQKQKVAAAKLRATLAQIAFWVVQDWRNEYLLKPCRGCGPDTGIPLARVWMWMRRDNRGKENLTTVYVNAYPPFRRMLSNDEWQLPADKISLGPHIWQPIETVMTALQRSGVSATQVPINADINLVRGHEVIFTNHVPAEAAAPLTMYTTADPHCPDQKRVVTFAVVDPANAHEPIHESTPATEQSSATLTAATAPSQVAASEPVVASTPATAPSSAVASVPVVAPSPVIAPAPVVAPVAAPPPPVTPAPVTPPAVNLTDLDGIGRGIARRLQNGGINSVADLAAARPETVRQALGSLPVPDARVEQMITQAQARM